MNNLRPNSDSAKDILMRIATRQLVELVEHYKSGFAAFEPDRYSMGAIESAANNLWETLDNAKLVSVPKGPHYARRKHTTELAQSLETAKQDDQFQLFLSIVTLKKEA